MAHLEQKGGKEGEILCNPLGPWGHGACFLIDWDRDSWNSLSLQVGV